MRKYLALLPLWLLAQAGVAQSQVVDQVIWVVGGEPILLSDVEEMRVGYEEVGMIVPNARGTLPEQIAVRKLWRHQAELDSIEVDEADISNRVDAYLAEQVERLGSRENVEQAAHKPFSQLRSELYDRRLEDELVEGAQRKLLSGVKVTPADVRTYFSRIPADSLPMVPEQVEVQILSQEPQPTAEEIERIQTTLREYTDRVNRGEISFSALARANSEDGSYRTGGELGFTGKGKWEPEFSKAAFALNEPGRISKIVRTGFGYHIIQLIEKRGDKVNVRHILLKPKIEDAEYTRTLLRLDSIADEIREGKFSFETGVLAISDDKDTRFNYGLLVNSDRMGNMTARFALTDLPNELRRVVDTLAVGQVSRSFMMTNAKGHTVCAIAKLKSRTPQHRASIEGDFQALQEMVHEKRCEEEIDRWIAEKQKTTYIWIAPEWRNYEFKYPGWVK